MISNQNTTPSETSQAARQAALNAVLRRLVAAQPRARAGAPTAPRPVPRAMPPAPAPAQPAPVPRWLTAPVLRLPIPDSPLAAGTAAPPLPVPEPEPAPAAQPEATASEVLEVPPVVEPIAEAKPEPTLDLAAQAMSEIAAIVAQAPEAIAPVVVDLSVAEAPEEPAAAPAAPEPEPSPQAAAPEPEPPPAAAAVAPEPAPSPRARTEPARRVTVRRSRPRVDHPQRRIAPPPPPRKTGAGRVGGRLDQVGNAVRPARPAAAQPASAPAAHPALPAAARAPTRERPVLAPAATAVARTLRTAAVPETRPLAQNRRLYRRVRLSAELEIAGKPCRLVDLSIGGFAATGTEKFEPGALVPVTLRMTIDGINIGTQFSARIVYGNGARAAGRFIDLTGAQTAFLRYIVTWRGEAIGAIGTTTLLDAITRWPERAFQPHPSTVKPPEPERPGFWSRLVSRLPLLGWRRRD